MDKIAKLGFLLTVAMTMAVVVMGKQQDEDQVKNIFGGPNLWPPLMKWGRVHPYEAVDGGSLEYGEYDVPEGSDGTGNEPVPVVKRSQTRQPICDVLLNIVYVGNGTDGYEYRPNHYVTETCLNSYNGYQNKCTESGLSCTQIRQKIYITRRKVAGGEAKAANCWEHVALKEIDAGCECMWPKEQIGDKHSHRLGK